MTKLKNVGWGLLIAILVAMVISIFWQVGNDLLAHIPFFWEVAKVLLGLVVVVLVGAIIVIFIRGIDSFKS